MAIEIRVPGENERRAATATTMTAFGEELRESQLERQQRIMPRDRMLAAYDGDRPVGLAASFEFTLTISGGEAPAAGVTWVGVLPSHRRRGILRDLMRQQLDDVHARGEPLAILWASEAAIYGRFGYGLAALNASIEADRARFVLRDDPGPRGAVTLVTLEEALQRFPPIYERMRRPGMFARPHEWWEHQRLADPEEWREGASPKFYAVLELDGEDAGFAVYRVKGKWENGFPAGELQIIDAFAVSGEATRELWRFLFGVDLVSTVRAWIFDPASPLLLQVADVRSLHLRLGDGLWLRLVDVEEALRRRSYEGADSVVLEVSDALLPRNDGRYRVGDGVGRTDDKPDVRLSVADLASAYLGGFDFDRLHAAGRVEELTPGAVARASALFRTPLPPFCPEIF
ncbi:MAG: GNAT family N-acetyltransferase [Thermoleophilia bacterium]|nr:GNAT family N-acetyltransferase [Thermoleophilia bacterium]